MTTKNVSFEELLATVLNKSFALKSREIEGLLTILLALIGSPSFSIHKVAKRSNGKFSRYFLAQCLKKYAYIQRQVIEALLSELRVWKKCKHKIYLLLDDTHVRKHGTRIFGSFSWYDHSLGRKIQSFCLVNVAVVVDEALLCILPWLLLDGRNARSPRRHRRLLRDQKTLAGIELLTFFVNYFTEQGIKLTQICVLADSWFSNRTMMTFVKTRGLNYRIDSKKNYGVMQPDHKAISKRHEVRRGRKRTRFVVYTPLEQYFATSTSWASFVDSGSQTRIYWKSAEVTLKTAGRVRVYAFQWKQRTSTKFILVPPQRKRRPGAKTVYRDYARRWRIEEAHRDLKQQFGLSKNQARNGWVVTGFIGLVALAYSVWRSWVVSLPQVSQKLLKCPTWAEEFHIRQIVAQYAPSGG